jgi:hypothetical protein
VRGGQTHEFSLLLWDAIKTALLKIYYALLIKKSTPAQTMGKRGNLSKPRTRELSRTTDSLH